MVDVIGIEPTTSSLRTRRSPKLSYTPEKRYSCCLEHIYYSIFDKFVKTSFPSDGNSAPARAPLKRAPGKDTIIYISFL